MHATSLFRDNGFRLFRVNLARNIIVLNRIAASVHRLTRVGETSYFVNVSGCFENVTKSVLKVILYVASE